jgi:hypothetical protein
LLTSVVSRNRHIQCVTNFVNSQRVR